ncbi:MAG: crotonase/enoyl-CoA hydratase family protein [Desulfatibacillaceae bacterium]|nr:crotonase/enoyl-CoA hydratase family protein [Desulfatibacillaceae bacterium]
MSERFLVEKDKGVSRVILNRPDKRNIMDGTFFNDLLEIFPALDKDPDVRCIVVSGAGKSFTAGLDLTWAGALLAGGVGADAREAMRQSVKDLQESMSVIERCKKPVIAAVHSHCIGGGMDMICACDIRLASADAVFSVRETRLAIIADLGTLQRLPHIVGQGWTRELALTGRDFTADEALKMGLVTRVLPDKQALDVEAAKLAEQIAALAPLTVQGVKGVLNFSRDNGVYSGLDFVAQKNAAQLPSEDLMEAVTAFMERRPPVFKGK